MFELESSWQQILSEEMQKPYFLKLMSFIKEEQSGAIPIYPPNHFIFNALNMTPYSQVKVVIVGQDPYHGPGQAHGLSFSVPRETPLPPSLKNIFKEMQADLGVLPASHGCLESWAKQGVLLLNATLTVRHKEPMSHHKVGWETFTNSVIEALARRSDPVIFVLWGKSAQEKFHHIDQLTSYEEKFILQAAHPSPFSAYQGFFGCRHFSKINDLLRELGKAPIQWELS